MVRGQEAVGKKREPRKFFWISHLSRRGVGRDAWGAPLVLERPRQRERRIRCNVIVSDRCARPTSSQLARVSASVADQQNISTLRASHRRSTLAPIAVFDRRRLGPQSEPARAREITAPVRSRSHQHEHESARVGRAETSANRSRSAEVAPPNHPRRRRLEDRIARCRGRRLDARRPGCTPRAPARPLP